MNFYNKNGEPIAYLSGDDIYLFDGKPVAYLNGNKIYGFNGKHLGWFEQGWVRDLKGNCAFYTEEAAGSGPVQPVRNVAPVKGVRQVKPVKSVKEIAKVKPVNSLNWSNLSGNMFFYQ